MNYTRRMNAIEAKMKPGPIEQYNKTFTVRYAGSNEAIATWTINTKTRETKYEELRKSGKDS